MKILIFLAIIVFLNTCAVESGRTSFVPTLDVPPSIFVGEPHSILKLNSPEPNEISMPSFIFLKDFNGATYDTPHWKIFSRGGHINFSFSGQYDFTFHALGSSDLSRTYIDIYVNGNLIESNKFIDKAWRDYIIFASNFTSWRNSVKIVLTGDTPFWIDKVAIGSFRYIQAPLSKNEFLTKKCHTIQSPQPYSVEPPPFFSTAQENQFILPNMFDSLFNDLDLVQGNFEQAIALSEKNYRLRKAVLGETHIITLNSMNTLANTYKHLGCLSAALPLLEKAYHISLRKKGKSTMTIMLNLGRVYRGLGKFSEALHLSEQVHLMAKERLEKIFPDLLTKITTLATTYYKEPEKKLLLEKVKLFRKELVEKKQLDIFMILDRLTNIYQNIKGSILLEMRPNSTEIEVSREIKHILSIIDFLAQNYRGLGRLDEALPLVEKVVQISEDMFEQFYSDTIFYKNNLAIIYSKLGRFDEAKTLYEEIYQFYEDNEFYKDSSPLKLAIMQNLASISSDLGDLSQALSLNEKAYRISQKVLGKKHPGLIADMNNLAGIYRDLGRLSEALPLYKKAHHLSQELLGEKHPKSITVLSNLASAYVAQGEFDKAIKHFEKFIEGVENLRSGDLSAENRQSLFKKWVPSYFDLSRLYIDQSRFQDAFRLAEMSKARTLLESIAAKLATQQSGLTSAEQQQLQNYEASLASWNNQIALANNHLDEKISLEIHKNQFVTKFTQFQNDLKAKYPKYAQLNQVQITTAKDGAKYLPKNAVLINYLVHENNVLAFTLQPNGKLTAHDLGQIPELSKHIQTYQHRLAPFKSRGIIRPTTTPGHQTTESLSQKLGKHLLQPLKNTIKNKQHWIISPSNSLALIPFETLTFEGQPTITQHQISYVQSLSILTMLQKRDKAYKAIKNRGSLFAMGAPIYEPTANRSIPSHTDFRIAANLVRGSGDSSRALRQLNLKWPNLPGALEELEQLQALFKGQQPLIYKQDKATEEQLQSVNRQGLLAKYHYLVFSAHGYLSSEVPALSSIVLAQVSNPPGIDGYVTAGEWVGYDLKSDLMVLSACETGLGKNIGWIIDLSQHNRR